MIDDSMGGDDVDEFCGESDLGKLEELPPLVQLVGLVAPGVDEGVVAKVEASPVKLVEYSKGTEAPRAVSMEQVEQGVNRTDRLLLEVRLRRWAQDQNEGFFRDYPDGTLGRRHQGPTAANDRHGPLQARRAIEVAMRAARPSWRHKLELACAEVYAEGDEKKLKPLLLEVAAVAISWAEGLEVRVADKRIAKEQNALKLVVENGVRKYVSVRPWWWRALAWLRLKK